MRVLWKFTFAYCEIIPGRIPSEKGARQKKQFRLHTLTSPRPLIKAKYQSAHDKKNPRMSHSHIPQI